MKNLLTSFLLLTSLTRNVSATALVYLKGLLLCRRRNCQVMADKLQESNGYIILLPTPGGAFNR
jgi:hypothetical protein